MHLKRTGLVVLILFISIAACSLPIEIKPVELDHDNVATLTLTTKLSPQTRTTITPTYPCPKATQELPPRIDRLVSPTDQLNQVVQILPGNYDEAQIETESGTFSGKFNGAEGAKVEVRLLPNSVHHLKVTIRVRQSTWGGCTYGGYTMTVYIDRDGHPLEIVQGFPPTPAPVKEPLGPQTYDRLKQLSRISLPNNQRAEEAIFGPDDLLVSVGMGQGVFLWQAPSGKAAGELRLNDQMITTVAAISPDGNWLATGSGGWDPNDENQTSVRLWNFKTKQVRLLGHHPAVVESLAFNPSGTLLASGGNDNLVQVWNVASGKREAEFNSNNARLENGIGLIGGTRQLFWMDNSTLMARGDYVIFAWKVPSGEHVLVLEGKYQNMDYSRPAGLLAVVQNGAVYLCNPASGKLELVMEGGVNSRDYQQVAFSPDGKMLAALNDTKITFWDISSRKVLSSGKNPAGVMLVFSPDWRYLAKVNWDTQNITLWGVQP